MCICTSSASKYYYIISKCLLTGKKTKRRLQRDNKSRQATSQVKTKRVSCLHLSLPLLEDSLHFFSELF